MSNSIHWFIENPKITSNESFLRTVGLLIGRSGAMYLSAGGEASWGREVDTTTDFSPV